MYIMCGWSLFELWRQVNVDLIICVISSQCDARFSVLFSVCAREGSLPIGTAGWIVLQSGDRKGEREGPGDWVVGCTGIWGEVGENEERQRGTGTGNRDEDTESGMESDVDGWYSRFEWHQKMRSFQNL